MKLVAVQQYTAHIDLGEYVVALTKVRPGVTVAPTSSVSLAVVSRLPSAVSRTIENTGVWSILMGTPFGAIRVWRACYLVGPSSSAEQRRPGGA